MGQFYDASRHRVKRKKRFNALTRQENEVYHEKMVKAVFPGTFDPPTFGHLNIIERGAALFDSLDVVIAVNPRKTPILHPDTKKELLETLIHEMGLKKVTVSIHEGLVVEYCRREGARVILRGVRALSDFDYEFELSMLNRQLNGEVETMLLPTDPKYFVLRSSTIKELLHLDGDISTMVPPVVEKALKNSRKGID